MLLRRHHVGVILCIFIFGVPVKFDEQRVADRQPDHKGCEDSGRGKKPRPHYSVTAKRKTPLGARVAPLQVTIEACGVLVIWLSPLTVARHFLLRRLIEVASVPGGFRVDEVLKHVAGLPPPQFALVLEDAVHGDAALIRLIHSWSPTD